VRRTYRRASFELARLLANMGAAAPIPLLERFHAPVTATRPEKRWLSAFYLDQPEEWDDPYRFQLVTEQHGAWGVEHYHPRSSPRNAECQQPETIRARTEVLAAR